MPWNSLWNKEGWWDDLSFHINTKNDDINIASPALAYLEKKYNRSRGRSSIGWQGSWGTELVRGTKSYLVYWTGSWKKLKHNCHCNCHCCLHYHCHCHWCCWRPLPLPLPLLLPSAIAVTVSITIAVTVAISHCRRCHRRRLQLLMPLAIAIAVGHCRRRCHRRLCQPWPLRLPLQAPSPQEKEEAIIGELLPWCGDNYIQTI